MASSESSAKTAGYQCWRHLVFLHWRIPPETLQALLPSGLTVETWDGSAWLALVPFSMEKVRPWWSPPVPGISWFLETNLRTYVRHNSSGRSAVWFFSLDANSRLAVRVARQFWNLNYQDCLMFQTFFENQLDYAGRRTVPPRVHYRVQLPLPDEEPQPAAPDSLEYFLLERYHLITQSRSGDFLCGQVHHPPYRYCPVSQCECTQSLVNQLLSDEVGPPDHIAWSPGVDVRVSPLQRIS